jgi:hypothetical protein
MAREGTMTDNVRRLVGLVIALFLIMVGSLLCLEAVWRGTMSEISWLGSFLAVVGGLWLASDWLDF